MAHLTQSDTSSRNTNFKTRCYAFTWNNYKTEDINTIINDFGTVAQYIFGEEVGESGTPHLQGAVNFKNARSFDALHKKYPKVHWEACRNWFASKNYCSKDGKTYTNIEEEKSEPTLDDQYSSFMEEEYKGVVWKPWQKRVIDIIEGKVDRRRVHWFWEPIGNTGKSFLTRYIEWKYPTIIVNGKQGDVFNGIKMFLETKKKYPNPVIIDIPRVNENYVCYGTMEKIKDGLFYSGKYEGGAIRLLPCHLLVFANFRPDTSKMSRDRWDIYEIEHT